MPNRDFSDSSLGAQILPLEEISKIRANLGVIVATSGGFDPIHPGHISCILASKKYGETLVVIVNGDEFLRQKKGKSFQDLKTRCLIVSALREVDYVVPFEIENDSTVSVALEHLKPDVFTKGGDRLDEKTIPEWQTCQLNGIKVITGVGLKKDWSSSDFLKEWEEHALQQRGSIE